MEVKICKRCSQLNLEGKWSYTPISTFLRQHQLNTPENRIKIEKAKRSLKLGNLNIKKTICDICQKMSSGYYEGILQLRGKNSSSYSQVLKKIDDDLSKRKEFISKTYEQKDGIDLYMSSNKYLTSLAKKLVARFGGTLKTSKSLFSVDRESSKELYRVTVLIRLPSFSKGDVVSIDNKLILVSQITSQSISGMDLKTSKKVKTKYGEPDEILQASDFFDVMVVKRMPHLEVMDPNSYQNVRPMNMLSEKKDSYKAVKFKDQLFLIE